MDQVRAAVWPSLYETRVLVTTGTGKPVLKARLRPGHVAHPVALERLLEAVSLWQGQQVHAVLAVDARAPGYGMCPSLSSDERIETERYVLQRIWVGMRRPRRALDGLGSFRALTRVLEEVP